MYEKDDSFPASHVRAAGVGRGVAGRAGREAHADRKRKSSTAEDGGIVIERPVPVSDERTRADVLRRWQWPALAVVAVLAVGFLVHRGWQAFHEVSDADTTTAEHRAPGAGRGTEDGAGSSLRTRPSFDVVRISRGGTGVIAGRAAPGSRVEILVNGGKVGEVRADRRGEWVFILEHPLAPGTAELSLKAVASGPPAESGEGVGEAADAASAARAVDSDDVVVVSIPERAQEQRFAADRRNGVVAVLTPRDGEGPSRVMQKPGMGAPGEIGEQLAVDTVDYGADGRTVFTGRGVPRSTVRVYLDNGFIGEAKVDDDGRWQVANTQPLAGGEHILRVDQLLAGSDAVELRVLQPFVAGDVIDPARAEQRVVVRPGNTLWAIARKLYGRGIRYTLIFQENSEQIADPDLIYPGQLFKVPKARDVREGNGATARKPDAGQGGDAPGARPGGAPSP